MFESAIVFLLSLVWGTGGRFVQNDEKPDLVVQVSDGVRLLGKPNTLAHLTWASTVFSPDGKYLVNAGERELIVSNRQKNEIVQTIPLAIGQRWPLLLDVQISKSGKFLVVLLLVQNPTDAVFQPYDLAEDLPDDWNIQSGQYLVVFENWKLRGAPLLVDPATTYQYPTPTIMISPNERWLIWRHGPMMQPFDLLKQQVLPKQEKFFASYFDSENELVDWDARQTLDLTTGKTSDWTPPEAIENANFNSVSLDGNFLVCVDKSPGVVIYNRQTKKSTRFAGIQDKRSGATDKSRARFGGQLSPRGNFFAGFGTKTGSEAPWFFVYDVQQEALIIEPSEGIASFSFMGDEPSILVRLYPDYSVHQIQLSVTSKAELKAAAETFPSSNNIQFANHNRHLVLGLGQRWIDVENGETFYRRPSLKNKLDTTFSGVDTTGYGFESATAASYSVQQRSYRTGETKTLYSHQSTSHLNHLLGGLLGGQSETTGVIGLHLQVDPTGQFLHEVRHESSLGFIFRQWDLQENKVGWEKTFRVQTPIVDIARVADISGDGRRFAVTTDKHLWVVDAESGTLVREFDLPKTPRGLTLDHCGNLIAVEYHSGFSLISEIVILNLESGEVAAQWKDGPFLTPVFSAAGDRVAVMRPGKANRLRVLETSTWKTVWTYETAHSPAVGMDITLDFRQLALSLRDSRLEIWDLRNLGL